MEGHFNQCIVRIGKRVDHLLEFSVPLPEPVSLTGYDRQDGCVRRVAREWYWSVSRWRCLQINTQGCPTELVSRNPYTRFLSQLDSSKRVGGWSALQGLSCFMLSIHLCLLVLLDV